MQNAIVLQGGGALGAYEFGVLKRLYELPDFETDLIAGVSIGAINAAVLAGSKFDNPIEALDQLWEMLAMKPSPFIPDGAEQFAALGGNPAFFVPRQDYWNFTNWTSYYDTRPLAGTLSQVINYDKLNSGNPRLILSATNIESGDIAYFDTKNDTLTEDHIMASGSLPPGFGPTHIAGNTYWDGGLFNNTPLSPVMDALKDLPSGKKRIFVINLFPSKGEVPQNMMDVSDRMVELLFSDKLELDTRMARHVNEYIELVKELEKVLPKDAAGKAIRSLPAYKRIKQYTYIDEIVVIEHDEPEKVYGAFDFSESSINKRIEFGYADASRALEQL
ncbi:MAG: patatin-like phospholipase family protein [Bacteroidota bacterium]